eukprot:CAMPEP_0170204634 /NCGR_PEP_ID=MMETSP0116_2-20130129/1847_1 /TAXON_ID=400756 /ORGANISM="Durinskia baltica, Strain CSIRO CS-38" /LENGTH=119 /DNA_ID=CAMNT_0010454997 /DNA_START=236 /DNA_END=591 /DNA_ORIENTATION=+
MNPQDASAHVSAQVVSHLTRPTTGFPNLRNNSSASSSTVTAAPPSADAPGLTPASSEASTKMMASSLPRCAQRRTTESNGSAGAAWSRANRIHAAPRTNSKWARKVAMGGGPMKAEQGR